MEDNGSNSTNARVWGFDTEVLLRTAKGTLFKRASNAVQPSLQHPTSNSFSPASWDAALTALPQTAPDDQALFDAARVIGEQVALLRPQIVKIFEGVSRSMAVMLITALANREFNAVSRKSRKAIGKATKDGPKHIELLTDIQLESGNAGNQKTNADSAVEATVDCIPHALFHAYRLEEFDMSIAEHYLAGHGANILASTSLERAYRILWQNCLWNADVPRVSAAEVVFDQMDYPAETLWQAWITRSGALKMEAGFEKGLYFDKPGSLNEADRLVKKTISGIERRAGRRNGPTVVAAKSWSDVQRHLAAKWSTLEHSYLSRFLDVHLPNAPTLSIRLLAKAWWALGELSEVLIEEMGSSKLASLAALKKQSFPMKQSVLIETIAAALQIPIDLARDVIAFLTVDTSNMTRLFNRGLWGNPIIKAPKGDNVYLLSPVLVIGDWVRSAEYWLEQGGGTDGVALRGPQFEIECREIIAASLQANTMLSDATCPLVGLPTRTDGEEIDCIIRIGQTVLVGECKCLLTPTEPIERYNFMERINDGCDQAARKAAWLSKNLAIAAATLGCSQAEASKFRYLGVVITNQSYGVGHNHIDIPVVDLKYIDLICGGGSYLGETIYDREAAFGASVSKHLYSSQSELERRLPTLLRDPVVMRRFSNKFEWIRFPVPSMTSTALTNMIPILIETDTDHDKNEMLKAIISSKNPHSRNK